MDEPPRPDEIERRKYRWPWFLLSAVVLAIILAVTWMSVAVKRMRDSQNGWRAAPGSSFPSAKIDSRPSLSTNDPLAGFRDLLAGGNSETGRKIFFDKPEANCAKCHAVGGKGAATGPALDGVGSRQTREFILESMLRPNLKISEGYDSIVLLLKNGTGCSGFLKNENESELHVLTAEDGLVIVKKTDVQVRQKGLSPMPERLDQLLSREDLRNLVEYVSSLK